MLPAKLRSGPSAALTALGRVRVPAPRVTERPEPRDAAGWLRDNSVTLTAVALVTIQLLWMGALLNHSYFRQDDYYNFDRALDNGFTWKYLTLVSAGHMAPLGFATSWALAKVALYNWPLTCLVILALVLATCFALLRVLRTLFGDRPAILIPLAVYLFSPLALAAVDWWSVAVQTLPLELAIFMAVDAHVRYLRNGRMRTAVAAAGWLLLGMATVQKGALVPLLLFGLTSGFFAEGNWAMAMIRVARQYWRAWLLYSVLMAGYCVLFFSKLPGSTTPPNAPGPVGRVISFISTLAGTTLVPGAVGGPWHWVVIGDGYAQANPPAALQQLSWALALLVVMVSCAYRVRAWRAWAILVGWIAAADVVPVVIGRLGSSTPGLLGLQARYVTDAVAVLALCLGFAFLPLAGQQDGYRFQVPATGPGRTARRITLGVLAIFLAGSFWSMQALAGITHTGAARSYIATARAAVAGAPRGALIADGPTPAIIMDPVFFYQTGYTSRVIGALARGKPAQHLTWTLSPQGVVPRLLIFDAQGQLRPAALAGRSSGSPAGRTCWPVTAARTSSIPLPGPLYRWSWTVRLDYSGPATGLEVQFGSGQARAVLPAGTHSFYLPVTGSGTSVLLRYLPLLGAGTDSAVYPAGPGVAGCLTGITVGTWQPSRSGSAIPAVPVPG